MYTWEGLIFHSCLHSIYVGGRLLSSQQSLMHRKQCLQECCSLIMLIYNCLYLKSDKSKYINIQLLVGIFIFKQRVDWGRFNILNVLVLSNISQCNLILQSFSLLITIKSISLRLCDIKQVSFLSFVQNTWKYRCLLLLEYLHWGF